MTNTHTSQEERAHPLVRTHEGRIIAGVATGVALRLDIPLWLVRLGFVVLTFFGGLGIAMYLAAWLLMRDEYESESIASRLVGRIDGAAGWVGVSLVGLAALIFLDTTGVLSGDLAAALVLAVIGVLLYRGELGGRATATTGEPPSDPAETSTSPSQETSPMIEAPPSSAAATEPKTVKVAAPPSPPKPPREPSKLGPLTFAFGFIVLGVVGIVDVLLTDFDPNARHYWSIGLTITGLGLVAGAWFGRARGLIALGVILVPIVVASPLADLEIQGSIGERNVEVESVSDVEASYELGVGSMMLDLSNVDFDGQTVESSAEVGIGELVVLVPDNVRVVVDGEAGIGEVELFGRSSNGVGVDRSDTSDGESGTLTLDLSIGIGTIEVREVEVARSSLDSRSTIDLTPVVASNGDDLTTTEKEAA